MNRIEFPINDEELIKLTLASYNRITIVETVEITKSLILKTINIIKNDIKMYSSIPDDTYKERIKFEVSNLLMLESYVILNFGINELEVK